MLQNEENGSLYDYWEGEMSRRRRAVITGGARGIGFGIAMAMLDAGYEVTVTVFLKRRSLPYQNGLTFR